MRILVTGGAGFIGSHLVEQLVSDGHAVTVIDNFVSGKLENLENVKSSIKIIRADIRSRNLEEIFYEIDIVYHLAALADIVPSITNPYEYIEVNVLGTTCILENARLAGVNRVIYVASSSCYGIPDRYPTPESSSPNPKYPYALSKYLGEQIFFHWLKLYGIKGLSLRLFNVYGPRARTNGNYGAVLGVFLGQKKSGLPLTIVGDGSQLRDFTYVSDVVEALIMAGSINESGYAINIGTSKPTSINKLAELIGGRTVNIPKRPGEPDQTNADISLAKLKLDWTPKVSIEQGIQNVLFQPETWFDAPSWTEKQIAIETETWFKYLNKGERD